MKILKWHTHIIAFPLIGLLHLIRIDGLKPCLEVLFFRISNLHTTALTLVYPYAPEHRAYQPKMRKGLL